MKIVVGMSGGIDSSVTALLLVKAGHHVSGVTMKLWPEAGGFLVKKSACFGPDEGEDIESAREVCSRLGISHTVIDLSKDYEDLVLRNFREEYLAGKTPNPCVRCNQLVKFGLLPRLAGESGLVFDRFATGHYARVEQDPRSKRQLLKKGVDTRKDQSYFLYRLSQGQLSTILLPLGGKTKEEVRGIAREAGLPVHDRKESQDFYAGDLCDIIRQEDREGEIVDREGRVLGRHTGFWKYTLGQRRGLGISFPVPLYVLAIDAERNRLIVGPEDETLTDSCVVAECNWIAVEEPSATTMVKVKIRSTAREAPAALSPLPNRRTLVRFESPVSAVTPGQSAVFYDGEIVLGGGVIADSGPL
jgi:tRNA-specific 2-thiouridylase